MTRENEQCLGRAVDLDAPTPMSLIDRLKAKRVRIATTAKREITKLDRMIGLLQASEAEQVVRDAERLLVE